MSLPTLPELRRKSRIEKWREQRVLGKQLNPEDIKKIIDLNHKLRDDGKRLGIPQISVEIVPREYEMIASAEQQGYRIKNDGILTMPSSISFDYRAVDKLSREELRSIAWHELGHYIFAYYFPDIDEKYKKDYDHYLISEVFADEFAFNKFGDVFIRATEKLAITVKKRDRETARLRVEELKRIRSYRKRYKRPYWMALAKKLGIEVKYNPTARTIVGIRPRKKVLDGVYEEAN